MLTVSDGYLIHDGRKHHMYSHDFGRSGCEGGVVAESPNLGKSVMYVDAEVEAGVRRTSSIKAGL